MPWAGESVPAGRAWNQCKPRPETKRLAVLDLLHKYPTDYKLIFVGDATLSPYGIHYPGGSVEHRNEVPGAAWLQRLLDTYPKAVWLKPQPLDRWDYTPFHPDDQRTDG